MAAARRSEQVLLASCCGVLVFFALVLTSTGAAPTALFSNTALQTPTATTSQVVLHARKPANDPNLGSYHVGAREANSLPTVGTHGSSVLPAMPAILAGLPTMLLPGLALVVLFALLRLFRNPILRLLGVNPVENDALNRQPYGYPPYGQSPYGYGGPPGAYGAPPMDVEASMQQLLQNATPEEAEQLQAIADRMKSRGAVGTTAARPAQWVTPEPIPASPAEALTPEEKRELARQKARSQAQEQVQSEKRNNTRAWGNKQVQAEKAAAAETFSQLEDDQKLVAVASVVLTAFVVAEADARGYQTR